MHPEPTNPTWKRKICLKPWTSCVVTKFSTFFCCFHQEAGETKFLPAWNGGPYAERDLSWWNSDEAQKFRKEMFEKGSLEVCKNKRCVFNQSGHNLQEEMYKFSLEYDLPTDDPAFVAALHGDTKLDFPPKITTTVLNGTCDAKCAFCIQSHASPPDPEMDEEKYANIINFLQQCRIVTLSGGEIFTMSDSRLDALFKQIKPFFLSIITNGQLITHRRFQKYVHWGPITYLSVSLNTCSVEEYKEGKVLENIFRIRDNLAPDLARLIEDPKIRFNYNFSCLLTKSVIPHIPEIISFAGLYRCPKIYFPILEPRTLIVNGLEEESLFGSSLTEDFLEDFRKYRKIGEARAQESGVGIGADSLMTLERMMERKLGERNGYPPY